MERSVGNGAVVEQQGGSYVLRELIRDVPLSAEGGNEEDVYITCVESWSDNLYIGTSANEILHFVAIPPDPSDPSGQPTYILASRLEPAFSPNASSTNLGVQQILVLPRASKACVLCNNSLTFYSLPELSPAFGITKPLTCTWVGGVDESEDEDTNAPSDGVVVMICLKSRIRLVRIGEEPRKIREIEFGGCVAARRRNDFACVADGKSYALLDILHQRKNDLSPISPLDEQPEDGLAATAPPLMRPTSRSVSHTSPIRAAGLRESHGHERISSLGAEPRNVESLRPDSPSRWPARGSSRRPLSPNAPLDRSESPATAGASVDKPLPVPPPGERTSSEVRRQRTSVLRPHIVSPTPNEFLLTTGTTQDDPGVGMFVSLEGDVTRGTLEFSSYPEALIVDGQGIDAASTPPPGQASEEGFVLAVVSRPEGERTVKSVEVQRWDLDAGNAKNSKEYVVLGGTSLKSRHPPQEDASDFPVGLRTAVQSSEVLMSGIGGKLALQRTHLLPLSLIGGENLRAINEATTRRQREEEDFTSRFSKLQARILLWCGSDVFWLLRNPLLNQLDARLTAAYGVSVTEAECSFTIGRDQIEKVINSIRGQDARSELEFLSLNYIRQKASLLLFMDLIIMTVNGVTAFEPYNRSTEDALVAGELDPRVVVALLPLLMSEVTEGPQGIWLPGGLHEVLELFQANVDLSRTSQDPKGAFGDNLLQVLKRYLLVWRRKKGLASIADENEVFHTVDAALIHVLLLLDRNAAPGPATAGSVRAELNGVVDHDVACFERAIELLEQFQRLYVLSRLYQSRKQVAKVLETWRRILDGEPDEGGELVDGEMEIRKYLSKIRNPALVKEYGAWLANRIPKLGVQVFADDSSRVRFQPEEAVAILKESAPGAVKDYLEHLVFGKNQDQYANDLITFYLDTVIAALSLPESPARTILRDTNSIYRALRPPKPTYRAFITNNALDAEWYHARLRLLQLIGGSHSAANQYDFGTLVEKLDPYSDELVPEMIILNGRQGRHQEALRLLVRGLGDYDTAIRYCLLGGASIFHTNISGVHTDGVPSRQEQEQLFEHLLHEFLRIDDLTEQLERTAELLERFGGWFDPGHVLGLIPNSWSVELLSGFLVHALRSLVRERNETGIQKALLSAQNLRISEEVIEKVESVGPTVETVQVLRVGD
ncbi:hypothetical protein LTR66_007835 [Elasticomyces elasticus]|nr:hypothetical protein LTR66_007835 [Elasticomyces elasticus]